MKCWRSYCQYRFPVGWLSTAVTDIKTYKVIFFILDLDNGLRFAFWFITMPRIMRQLKALEMVVCTCGNSAFFLLHPFGMRFLPHGQSICSNNFTLGQMEMSLPRSFCRIIIILSTHLKWADKKKKETIPDTYYVFAFQMGRPSAGKFVILDQPRHCSWSHKLMLRIKWVSEEKITMIWNVHG